MDGYQDENFCCISLFNMIDILSIYFVHGTSIEYSQYVIGTGRLQVTMVGKLSD